jgi:uncharacterized membrane protein
MKDEHRIQNIFSLGGKESAIERLAVSSTRYIGSPTSLVLHTAFFIVMLSLPRFGVSLELTMLVLTTVVSLEAIYLSLFIQMTVNRQARQIEEVSEDVDDIQEDVEEISKDIDEIQEDVEEIHEHSEEMSADMEGLHEHIEDIKENVEDITEELVDDEPIANEAHGDTAKVERIERVLVELLDEVRALKRTNV